MTFRNKLVPVAVLVLVVLGTALALEGKKGYVATRLFDVDDALVAAGASTTRANFGGSANPRLAVDSQGDAFAILGWVDGPVGTGVVRHEIVHWDATTKTLRSILDTEAQTESVRAILISPVTTFDPGTGAEILRKDHLVVLVDGFDPIAQQSFREIWSVDPGQAAPVPTVLMHQADGGTNDGKSVGGILNLALDLDGNFYVMEDSGSIRKIAWDAVLGEYAELANRVTSPGTASEWLTVGPDGMLYTISALPAQGSNTRSILRVDPNGLDAITEYATVNGGRIPLAWDSLGQLFALTGDQKGQFIAPVTAGEIVRRKDRIAESDRLLEQLVAGPDGSLFVLDRGEFSLEIQDNTVYELAKGEDGGGPGGGNGGGKGKPKK